MSDAAAYPAGYAIQAEERATLRLERTWLAVVAAGFGVLAYADMGNLLSSAGPVGSAGKLVYMASLVALFASLAVRRGHFRRIPTAWVLLAFTFVTAAAYAAQLAMGRAPNSYLTAFMPTTLYTLVLVLPDAGKPIEGASLLATMTVFLMLLGGIYAIEIGLRAANGELGDISNLENHVKSIALVLAAGLAIAAGRWAWLAVIIVLAAWVTALRPSSTFILAMLTCCTVSGLLLAGQAKLAGIACYAVLFVLAVSPFVVSFVPGADELVLSVEGALKEDLLGGQTNTFVRLVIQQVALSGLQGFDWLVGDAFTGATSVYVADLLPWWWDNSELGLATIHSDYVIMLVQSGLVGYLAYNLVLVAICAHGLRRRPGEDASDRALRAVFPVVVLALAIYSAANPFLQYYQTSHVAWLCLGLALYAFQPAKGAARANLPSKATMP